MDGGPNIRALLHRRREELIKLRDRVRAHVNQIEEELESIEKAFSVITADTDAIKSETLDTNNKIDRPIPGMTMKEAALEILEKHPSGCTAVEIRYLMRDMFGMNYERSSLSPQLSRLKFDGIIARRDGRWILPKYVVEGHDRLFTDEGEQDTASEAEASEATETA